MRGIERRIEAGLKPDVPSSRRARSPDISYFG
jgi:hypothetical protein